MPFLNLPSSWSRQPTTDEDTEKRSQFTATESALSTPAPELNEKTDVEDVRLNRVDEALSGEEAARPKPHLRTWLQVLAGHFIIQCTWGFVNSFGAFMSYYEETKGVKPSTLAWIGSCQVCLIFMVAPLSGWLHDRGYFRWTLLSGSFFVIFGTAMTSFGQTFWQLLLSQGLCIGIGNGLLFCCTTALVQSHFQHHWPNVATALTLGGAATGGMVFPAMFENLQPKIGFAWTIRCQALYMLIVMGFANLLFRAGRQPRKNAKFIDKPALKQTTFWLYAFSMFFVYLALFFGYYHITPFARIKVHVPRKESINLLLLMNGIGFVGRATSGYLADQYLGPLNVMLLFTFASGVLLFGMTGVHDVPGLWIFAAIYGIFAAGVQSLFPSALATVAPDQSRRGVVMGMTCFIVGQAALIGPPIEGELVAKYGYVSAQVFGGLAFMFGTAGVVWTRAVVTGGAWVKKA